jgi:hypothetical protein
LTTPQSPRQEQVTGVTHGIWGTVQWNTR